MKNPYWLPVNILLIVCLALGGIAWLSQPSPAHASALAAPVESDPGSNAGGPVEAPPQALDSAPPAAQVVVALAAGLFGILALSPLIVENKRGPIKPGG